MTSNEMWRDYKSVISSATLWTKSLGCGVPDGDEERWSLDVFGWSVTELEHFALVTYTVEVYWGYFRVHDVDVCIVA